MRPKNITIFVLVMIALAVFSSGCVQAPKETTATNDTPTLIITPKPTSAAAPIQSQPAYNNQSNSSIQASTSTAAPIQSQPAYNNQSNSSIPTGATAKCKDGTYYFGISHRGACSHHGGVNILY
jgi:hypothetical protein